MSYVLSLPWDMFVGLVTEAAEQRQKEMARQEWLAHLPWMGKDDYVSWDDFYARRRVAVHSGPRRSREEILADAKKIRQKVEQTA